MRLLGFLALMTVTVFANGAGEASPELVATIAMPNVRDASITSQWT